MDDNKDLPKREDERPDDLTKVSHERKSENLVDHKILRSCDCSLERT